MERTDNYQWTINYEGGNPVSGTFIDGTPWIYPNGSTLTFVNVSPGETYQMFTDIDGVTAEGWTQRTAINPDFGIFVRDQSYTQNDPEPSTGLSFGNPLNNLENSEKVIPFDFRAGNYSSGKSNVWGDYFNPNTGVSMDILQSTGIVLQPGDMIITQTAIDMNGKKLLDYSGSFGILTVVGSVPPSECYRPPINWDYNKTSERANMFFTRQFDIAGLTIDVPNYDYNGPKTWSRTHLFDQVGTTMDGLPGTVNTWNDTRFSSNPLIGSSQSLSSQKNAYPSFNARDEAMISISTLDPTRDYSERKYYMDILVQRGIDQWGARYSCGKPIKSDGGHSQEFMTKMFFAWCVTDDSRIYDMLDYKIGNTGNNTFGYQKSDNETTGLADNDPSSIEQYEGFNALPPTKVGSRFFGLEIRGACADADPQWVDVERPRNDRNTVVFAASCGYTAAPGTVQYHTPIAVNDNAILNFNAWNNASNTTVNPIDNYFVGAAAQVAGSTATRIIQNSGLFYPNMAINYAVSNNQQVLEVSNVAGETAGITFEHITTFAAGDYIKEEFTANHIGFIVGDAPEDYHLAVEFDDHKKMTHWIIHQRRNQRNTSEYILKTSTETYNVSGGDCEIFNIGSSTWGPTGDSNILRYTQTVTSGEDGLTVSNIILNEISSGNTVDILTLADGGNPDRMRFYFRDNIISGDETGLTMDIAHVPLEEKNVAILRSANGGYDVVPAWCNINNYNYAIVGLGQVEQRMWMNKKGTRDDMPKWGKFMWDKGELTANNLCNLSGMFVDSPYSLTNDPVYMALFRQEVNGGQTLDTPPSEAAGGYGVTGNWPETPTLTIEGLTYPNEDIVAFSYTTKRFNFSGDPFYLADGRIFFDPQYGYQSDRLYEEDTIASVQLIPPVEGEANHDATYPHHGTFYHLYIKNNIFHDNNLGFTAGDLVTYGDIKRLKFYIWYHDTTEPEEMPLWVHNAANDADTDFSVLYKYPDPYRNVKYPYDYHILVTIPSPPEITQLTIDGISAGISETTSTLGISGSYTSISHEWRIKF